MLTFFLYVLILIAYVAFYFTKNALMAIDSQSRLIDSALIIQCKESKKCGCCLQHCYVLDVGSAGIYVWMGKHCSTEFKAKVWNAVNVRIPYLFMIFLNATVVLLYSLYFYICALSIIDNLHFKT